MTITFKQYAAGERPNLKPAADLVMGWMVRDTVSNREYLYAVLNDGTVLRCDAPLGTDDFDRRGRTWWMVDTVPPCAEWIGHYPHPHHIVSRTVLKITDPTAWRTDKGTPVGRR
jgi:hypothetical protein